MQTTLRAAGGLLTIALACLLVSPARAINHGDLLVADRQGSITWIEVNGTQTSFTTQYNTHGFVDVTTDESGRIFAVTDGAVGAAIVRLDPATGAQTTAGFLQSPRTIDIAPDGDLYVCDGDLVRVGSNTEVQSQVLQSGVLDLTIGSNGVAHAFIALAGGPSWLFRVDLATGDTTRVPAASFNDVRGLATDVNGNLIVSEYDAARVSRVDPTNGAATVLASGFPLQRPYGVAVESGGSIGHSIDV